MSVDKSVPPVAWPTLLIWACILAAWALTALLGASGAVPLWAPSASATALAFWAFTPMHDAAHGSVSRSAALNRLVGEASAVLLNAPFAVFKFVHLTHHRFTNEPGKDPDHYTGLGPAWLLPLRWATIEPHYYAWYLPKWGSRPWDEKRDFLLSMGAQAVILGLLVRAGLGKEAVLCWLLPARLAMALLAFSFDWFPHQPYAATQAEDRFRATHVVSLPLLTPLWLWQNYHLIHHLYPALPCYRYAAVWKAERDELRGKGARDLWEEFYRPAQRRRSAPAA